MSGYKQREVNVFFIQTPDHFIQVVTPIKFSGVEIAVTQVLEINPTSPFYLKETHKVEKHLVSVEQNKQGTDIKLEANGMKVNFERKLEEGKSSVLSVQTDELRLLAGFNGLHESLYWSQPLTADKKTEFITWKRAGIPLEPFVYDYKGRSYFCDRKKCLMTTDQFRGHHNYGMQFYFGLMQGYTDAGDAYGIVLSEGIGHKYPELDRATEDHININGVVHKLDKIDVVLTANEEKSKDLWFD